MSAADPPTFTVAPNEQANAPSGAPGATGQMQRGPQLAPGAHGRMENGYQSRRRVSVFAEPMTPSTNAPKVVIAKSEEARARINEVILKNFLFRNLDDALRKEVVDAMFERKIAPGESPIVQGDTNADNYYVVDSGKFDIFVNGNKVLQVGAGGAFGELALMYNAPRAATVTAVEDSVVWGLDRVTFRRTVMNATSQKRKLYEEFLAEVPILEDLEAAERSKIADVLDSRRFAAGEVIIKQGDAGDSFFIIESGAASVRQKKDSMEIELVRLRKGNYFGEIALLTDQPRAASVVAVGEVATISLDRGAFNRVLGSCHEILKRNINHYSSYEAILHEMGKKMETPQAAAAPTDFDTPSSTAAEFPEHANPMSP